MTGQRWNQLSQQDPAIATLINLNVVEAGLFIVAFGVLGMALSRFSYRKGERWSWYGFWILPVAQLGLLTLRVSISGTLVDAVALLLLILLIKSLLGLILPLRRFFPPGSSKAYNRLFGRGA